MLAASGGGNDSAFQRHAGLIQAARSGTASNPALYEAIYELHATYGNAYVQRLVAHVDAQTVAEDVTQSPSVKSAEEEDTYPVTPEVASRIDMERPSGRPLDNDTRSDIEASLGRDLGNVRLHDDAESDELSRLVEAEAFTSREDVFVRGDGFDASTGHDRQVLAHELTHVLSNAGQSGIQRYSETTGGEEETSEDEGDVDEATARDMPDKNLLEFIDAGQEDLVQYVDGDELSDGQRLRLIEIALKLHEYEAMRRLWQSFSSLEEAAAANFDLWSRCAETDDGLFALPEILDIEDAFRADVTTVRNLSLQMSRESRRPS